MRNRPPSPTRHFEFNFPQLDTLVRVERGADGVVVRATRDTFTLGRKTCFIRELAAEGFIPDEYRWWQLALTPDSRGVRWIVDFTWLAPPRDAIRATRQFMTRVLVGSGLLWCVLMMRLIVHGT